MYFEHKKGIYSESLVAKWFVDQGWQILGQRIKTPYAEVDLLIQKNDLIKMIEVKSLGNRDFISYRVTLKQKKRLEQALIYFSSKYQFQVVLEIVFVDAAGEIELMSWD